MKASIGLEYIGEGAAAKERLLSGFVRAASFGSDAGCEIAKARRPWVAEIVGIGGKFGLERRFVNPTVQRRRGSSTGNRGTEYWFICESERIYQAQHYISWRSKERFFFMVTDGGDIEKLEDAWARNRLALMFLPPRGNG